MNLMSFNLPDNIRDLWMEFVKEELKDISLEEFNSMFKIPESNFQIVELEVDPFPKNKKIPMLWDTNLNLSFAIESRSLKYLERMCQTVITTLEAKKARKKVKKFLFITVSSKIVPEEIGDRLQLAFFKQLEPAVRTMRIRLEDYERAQRNLLPFTFEDLDKVESCGNLESQVRWIG